MTDTEFERHVRQLVDQDGMIEPEARLKVSLDAGDGGDFEGAPDPGQVLEQLGDHWKPIARTT